MLVLALLMPLLFQLQMNSRNLFLTRKMGNDILLAAAGEKVSKLDEIQPLKKTFWLFQLDLGFAQPSIYFFLMLLFCRKVDIQLPT